MNKKRVIIFSIIVIFISIFFININSINKTNNIEKILSSDSYNYLPVEAKSYVKEIYNETNEIVRTEKNKINNQPYLNPQYIEYLTLSESEQKNINYIPDTYIVDFNENNEYTDSNDTNPSYFSLLNYNGKNYVSSLKNQGSLGVCWAFSTLSQAESYLMLKDNIPSSDFNISFSARQLDYALSTDGIKDYDNDYKYRELGGGSNFIVVSNFLSKGLGFVTNFKAYNDSDYAKMELFQVFNFDSSLYEVTETKNMPQLKSNVSSDNITAYNNIIKNFIIENGGAMVSTQSANGNCSTKNIDGNYITRVDSKCDKNANHALHIIGWDDNYEYKYCADNDLKHTVYTSSCKNVETGRGAWILKNSWGTKVSYPMLAYDSESTSINFITNLRLKEDRKWDNIYDYNFSYDAKVSNTFSPVTKSEFEFINSYNNKEKIEEIKFQNASVDNTVKIYGTKNGNKVLLKTIKISYPGINTIDLSNENIILNNDRYKITLESTGSIYNNSLAVYTSNVEETPYIKTTDYSFNQKDNNYFYRIKSITRNIDSNSVIKYKLYDSENNEMKNNYYISMNKVAHNVMNAEFTFDDLDAGKYRLEYSFGDNTYSSNIFILKDNYSISFNPNGGIGSMADFTYVRNTSVNLPEKNFIKTGYTFRYWNTKADNSGVRYDNKQLIEDMYSDLELYAIWSANKYSISFNPNGGIGSMLNQNATYGESVNLTTNTYSKVGYKFKEWNTASDGSGTKYNDSSSVLNLTSTNNDIVTLYAIWEKNNDNKLTLNEVNNLVIQKGINDNKDYNYFYIIGKYLFTSEYKLNLEDLMLGARTIDKGDMTTYLYNAEYDDDWNFTGYKYIENFTGTNKELTEFEIEYIDYEPIKEDINITSPTIEEGTLLNIDEVNDKVLECSNTRPEYYYMVGQYLYTSNHKLTIEDLMLGARTIKVSDNSGYTNKDNIYKEMTTYLFNVNYNDDWEFTGYHYIDNFTGEKKYNNEKVYIKYIDGIAR